MDKQRKQELNTEYDTDKSGEINLDAMDRWLEDNHEQNQKDFIKENLDAFNDFCTDVYLDLKDSE